jgi:hypothetical protein
MNPSEPTIHPVLSSIKNVDHRWLPSGTRFWFVHWELIVAEKSIIEIKNVDKIFKFPSLRDSGYFAPKIRMPITILD